MTAIDRICPDARKLLLIPENHTRNLFYLQNVAQIAAILRLTGLEVRLGSLLPEIDKPTPVALPDGATLLLEPLRRSAGRLGLADFDPCAILLNNDLSAGIPEILQDLDGQFVLPPLHAGWALRRKSNHFAAYDEVAGNFAKLVGIDPWRINPYFSVCDSVNFHERQGEDCLAANVDAVLGLIREKYRQYGIDETPYVVVKADAGTYGMGVMTVKDASR
jgi:glutamate--cysteine ligase